MANVRTLESISFLAAAPRRETICGCISPEQLSPPSLSSTTAPTTLGSTRLPGAAATLSSTPTTGLRPNGNFSSICFIISIWLPLAGAISGMVATSHESSSAFLNGKNCIPNATWSLTGATSTSLTACCTTSQNDGGRPAAPGVVRQSSEPSEHSMREAELSSKSSTSRGLVETLTAAVPQTSVAHDLPASTAKPDCNASQP